MYQHPSCSLLARYQELKIDMFHKFHNSSSKFIKEIESVFLIPIKVPS